MIATEKSEIRQVVVEVLQEIVDRSGPPDRLMLFLYQFIGDFKDFRHEMLDFKASTEGRFDGVDGRLDGIDGRFDSVEGRFDGVDGRFNKVEGRLDGIDGRLDGIDGRLDKVDGRLDKVDGRLDKVDGRLDNIEKNMFTKADWETEKLRLIEGIGAEFKRIVKEDFSK
jgi:tetrahydromethanopterin S-methyltransferase subunit G